MAKITTVNLSDLKRYNSFSADFFNMVSKETLKKYQNLFEDKAKELLLQEGLYDDDNKSSINKKLEILKNIGLSTKNEDWFRAFNYKQLYVIYKERNKNYKNYYMIKKELESIDKDSKIWEEINELIKKYS